MGIKARRKEKVLPAFIHAFTTLAAPKEAQAFYKQTRGFVRR